MCGRPAVHKCTAQPLRSAIKLELSFLSAADAAQRSIRGVEGPRRRDCHETWKGVPTIQATRAIEIPSRAIGGTSLPRGPSDFIAIASRGPISLQDDRLLKIERKHDSNPWNGLTKAYASSIRRSCQRKKPTSPANLRAGRGRNPQHGGARAPAIGVAAAMGIGSGVKNSKAESGGELKRDFDRFCEVLSQTRPNRRKSFLGHPPPCARNSNVAKYVPCRDPNKH